MEIEGPESPIRSVRDFAVHIATVTLGILIALGLEALVEVHRNHELVEHARNLFRTEFAQNRATLEDDIARSAGIKAELEGLIQYGSARLARQRAPFPALQPARRFAHAPATAWETAVATQALVHLPFPEAGAISAAQSKQVEFNALQDRAESQWFELAAYGDPQHVPDGELRAALQKVTIAYAYFISVQVAERQLRAAYDRALTSMPR